MHQRLTYLVLLLPLAWIGVSASLDLDFEANPDTYYPDDTLFTSMDTSEWSDRDSDWNPDPNLNLELSPDLNPDLLVNTDSDKECQADADQLQMTTSRRLRSRDLCPIPLTPSSSQDSINKKFLDSLPILSLYMYKEPDPNICPGELFDRFIYPICGSGEEKPLADDTIIYPCNPCTPLFTQSREKYVRE